MSAAQIKPAPELSGAVHTAYITGIATLGAGDGGRMPILLDIEQLMSCESIGLRESTLQ